MSTIEVATKQLFDKIADIVFPNLKVSLKVDIDPQSEVISIEEETKTENEFTRAILKESTDFLEAVKNFQIVQVQDISNLVRMKTIHMQEIESMGKVSDSFKTMFKDMLQKMDDQISALE